MSNQNQNQNNAKTNAMNSVEFMEEYYGYVDHNNSKELITLEKFIDFKEVIGSAEWDYPIDEYDHITREGIDAILVRFLDEYGEEEFRYCEIPEQDYSDSYRVCSVCGAFMTSGYVVGNGESYYCSDNCLHTELDNDEYNDLYESDAAYWTEWY